MCAEHFVKHRQLVIVHLANACGAKRARPACGKIAKQEVWKRRVCCRLDKKMAMAHGDLDVDGIALPEPAPPPPHQGVKREAVVQDGTIDADLIYLNAALRWAKDYRVNGEPLLKSKPKVPRCKPQAGTLRQPMATEDDLEAMRPVLDGVDPQGLLRYWVELVNQFGWRVTGLSSIKASDIDFTPQPHQPYGRLIKNAAVDKERRYEAVPLTKRIADLLRELLALRGLSAGDDAYLFPAPKSGETRPWSRWHAAQLLVRAEEAAAIAHIGGLHAWRRKWHTERKNYPAQDVAAAAGHADVRSVDRYRRADAATTYLVVSTPTVPVRRQPAAAPAAPPERENTSGDARSSATASDHSRAKLRRRSSSKKAEVPTPVGGVGQGSGSSAKSVMPDGTVVESREARFDANLAVARAYAGEHGHLMPKKHERPNGVDLQMWLKNQEARIVNGTMPHERLAALDAVAAWKERLIRRGIGVAATAM